jgi:hypothetical protein
MRTLKAKTPIATGPIPVWCNSCFIRIAPYDLRTVHHGKDYHRVCFAKTQGARKTVKR